MSAITAAEKAAKHAAQFDTQIEIRKSKELHDRLVIVDGDDCWISGSSIRDGGKKVTQRIAKQKISIHEQFWSTGKQLKLE